MDAREKQKHTRPDQSAESLLSIGLSIGWWWSQCEETENRTDQLRRFQNLRKYDDDVQK